jgi:hypothetical protein
MLVEFSSLNCEPSFQNSITEAQKADDVLISKPVNIFEKRGRK